MASKRTLKRRRQRHRPKTSGRTFITSQWMADEILERLRQPLPLLAAHINRKY